MQALSQLLVGAWYDEVLANRHYFHDDKNKLIKLIKLIRQLENGM